MTINVKAHCVLPHGHLGHMAMSTTFGFYVVLTCYKIKYMGKSFLLRKHIYLSFSQMPQNNLSQTFQVELAYLQTTPNTTGLFQFEIKNPLTK